MRFVEGMMRFLATIQDCADRHSHAVEAFGDGRDRCTIFIHDHCAPFDALGNA
jgi:hypothetical protein